MLISGHVIEFITIQIEIKKGGAMSSVVNDNIDKVTYDKVAVIGYIVFAIVGSLLLYGYQEGLETVFFFTGFLNISCAWFHFLFWLWIPVIRIEEATGDYVDRYCWISYVIPLPIENRKQWFQKSWPVAVSVLLLILFYPQLTGSDPSWNTLMLIAFFGVIAECVLLLLRLDGVVLWIVWTLPLLILYFIYERVTADTSQYQDMKQKTTGELADIIRAESEKIEQLTVEKKKNERFLALIDYGMSVSDAQAQLDTEFPTT